jgi:hypothetical protein
MHVRSDRRKFLGSLLAAGVGGRSLLAVPLEVPAGQAPRIEPLDYINRVHVQFTEETQRFGICCPRLRDPRNGNKPKLLTRDERGITNNTCVRIEGYEYLFGREGPGVRYVKDQGKVLKAIPIPGKDQDRSWMSVWESEFGKIRITQAVEIVVGEQTRLYDTVLVKYLVENRDDKPHTVGLRVMLDTFIGSNDGVPFLVPATATKPAHLVDKMEVVPQKDLPDYIQALESSDLTDKQATVAVVGLKLRGCESIEKLVICRWPQNSEARWGGTGGPGDWVFEPMDKNPNAKDSCVVMYWPQREMKASEVRQLAFTYGLGRVLGDQVEYKNIVPAPDGKLRLFIGGRGVAGKPVVVAAYVKGEARQKISLKLPAGLALVEGEKAEQPSPDPNPAGYSLVIWRVQAAKPGQFIVEAQGPGGAAKEVIEVRETSLFD